MAPHLLIAKARLGEDLCALIETLDAPLVSATRVSTLPSRHRRRAAFRLELADGRVLKGRRLESSSHAERIEGLSRLLDHRYFPRVLARRGAALLMEWIEGRPLAASDCHPDLFRRCGRLHGSLHSIPLTPLATPASAPDWRTRLDEEIEALVRSRALGRRDGEEASKLAVAYAPGGFAVGLTHGDFCRENMVVPSPGRISVIDNESLGIGAYEYDLARTWYRWPMSSREHEAYFAGYEEHRSAAAFRTHFLHWAVIALVKAALFRVQSQTRDVQVPIRRLEALLRDARGRISDRRASPLLAPL